MRRSLLSLSTDQHSLMGQPWILDYDSANCAIGAAVGIIGERPTFLALREVFNGVRRFDDMQRRTGMPRAGAQPAAGPPAEEGLSARRRTGSAVSAAETSTGSPTRASTCTRRWWR